MQTHSTSPPASIVNRVDRDFYNLFFSSVLLTVFSCRRAYRTRIIARVVDAVLWVFANATLHACIKTRKQNEEKRADGSLLRNERIKKKTSPEYTQGWHHLFELSKGKWGRWYNWAALKRGLVCFFAFAFVAHPWIDIPFQPMDCAPLGMHKQMQSQFWFEII